MKRILAQVTPWVVLVWSMAAVTHGRIIGQPAEPTLAARIDAIFAGQSREGAPGCAVGVARTGQPVFSKGYGSALIEQPRLITPQTAFNIGSVAKQFTAVATLLLEQRGRLSLDDDIRRYVPELPDYGTPIRLRDLLYHSSGLRDFGTLELLGDQSVVTNGEFLRLIGRQRGLNFAPGARHEYSHTDYTLLGIVLERIGQEPLGDFLAREVWQPLGMTSTRLHDSRRPAVADRAFAYTAQGAGFRVRFPDSELIGGSNVYTTVDDLLRWDANFHEPRVGGRALVDRLRSRPSLATGEPIPYAYGLMLGEHRGLPIVHRSGSGGGFSTTLLQYPGSGLAVATLCNLAQVDTRALSEEVAGLFLAAQMTPRQPAATSDVVPAPADELARFPGTYQPADEPWNITRITARDGALYEPVAHDLFRLDRLRDGRYHDSGVFYSFAVPPDGGAVRLTLSGADGDSERLEQVPADSLWRPSASLLDAYAGTFYSTDLDHAWAFVRSGPQLVLHRPGHPDQALVPIAPELFLADIGSVERMFPVGIRFEGRGGSQAVAFTVSATPTYEAVRNLRFERILP